VRYTSPVLWTIGFIVTFTIGGMTGVLMAIPPADFVLHNSVFLIAHFHNVIIGGVVFGCLAGLTYWFPKVWGFTLDETLGKAVFWFWFIGFYVAFMPLYILGLMGMTRRMNHYDHPSWNIYLYVAAFGAFLILIGIILQIVQLVYSIMTRERRRDTTGDPWKGRTLEWATSSPPPVYNFAVLPVVDGADAFWKQKMEGAAPSEREFEEIEMPKNSPLGFFLSFFAAVGGFAMIWHIFWLGAICLAGIVLVILLFAWDEHDEYTLPAAVIKGMQPRT
jgi:cytochrome o ubiquinol oxidase subunit 1